jgi:DNA-binding transcriptional LysR family regulator
VDTSWEDAQTFLVVAEQHSFSGAARFLGLGQPTISRRIANIEERVGCQLFRRGKRGAELTGDGARLLPAAAQMARWAGEFDRLAKGAEAEMSGTVRLAAPPGLAVEFLAPFANLARERLPEIRLEILASIEHIDLSRGAADLAVRTRRPAEPELMSLHSANVELGVFASESYAASLPRNPSVADLDWITWAFPYEHVEPRPFLEAMIENFAPAFASDNFLVQKSAAAEGLGAMILERDRHPMARSPELVEIDLGLELPPGEFHLVCAKSMQYVPRVKGVADLLIEQLSHRRGG